MVGVAVAFDHLIAKLADKIFSDFGKMGGHIYLN